MEARRLTLVVLLLAVAGTTWWLSREPTPDTSPGPAPAGDATGHGPVLTARVPAARDAKAANPKGGTLVIRVLEGGTPVPARVRVAAHGKPARPSGEPAFDASVAPLATQPRPAWLFDRHADAGPLELPLAPGRHEVDVRLDDGRCGVTRVSLGHERRTLDVDIAPGGHTCRLTALRGDGAPFHGWILLARQGSFDADPWGDVWRGPAACDADGVFELPALPADEYVVWAVDPSVPAGTIRTGLLIPTRRTTWIVDDLVRTIEGRVSNAETARPLSGVHVRFWDGYAGHDEAVTREDGTFTLRASAWQANVEIRAAGFAPWQRTVPRTTSRLAVALHPSRGLRGRVVPAEAGGADLAGVTVFAGAVRAETDGEGRYAFSEVPHEPYTLFALGGGWCSVGLLAASEAAAYRPLLCFPGQEGIDLPVLRTGAVHGTVRRRGGGPAAGITLRAYPTDHASSLEREARTDADGSFVLRDLVPDLAYTVVVREPPGPESPQVVRVRSGETLRLDFELAPVEVVLVCVVDDASRPVAGAGVFDSELALLARTSASGEAEIPLPPVDPEEQRDPYAVRAAGFAQGLFAVPAAREGPIEVRLSRGLVTTGTVRMTDGSALPPLLEAHVLGLFDETVAVDEAGRFEARLVTGTHEIWASGERRGVCFSGSRIVDAGTHANEILLTLEPGRARTSWTIRVEGPDGRRPALVHVNTFEVSAGGSGHMEFQRAFDGGVVVVPAASGETPVWIGIYGAEGEDGADLGWAPQVVGPLGTEGGERTVRMSAGLSLSGRALSTDGVPLPGVRVRAVPTTGPIPQWGRNPDQIHASAWSDVSGAFALRGLAKDVYQLDVAGPPTHVRRDDVKNASPGDTVLLRFQAVPDVAITVLDEAGAPVQARVTVAGRSVATDAAGLALLRGLDPDRRYTLDVQAEGLRRRRHDDWTPAHTTVRLDRGLTIRGRLLDERGEPYGRARVELLLGEQYLQEAPTQPDGRFSLSLLDAGTYRLQAVVGEASVGVAIQATAGTDVGDWQVDPGPQICVEFEGLDATQELPTAYLRREDDSDGTSAEVLGGRVRFAGLDAGVPYALWLHQGTRYVWLRNLKPSAERLRTALLPGGSITGRVTGRTDHDRTYGLKVFVQSGGIFVSAETDTTGRFVLQGVPPGTWTVEAGSWLGEGIGTPATASPGDRDVVIDVTRPK